MKIYVAAPWVHKADARAAKERLQRAGFTVTSRWIDFKETQAGYEYPEQVMRQEAMNDVIDVREADALIYLNLAKSEGKATEMGMAIAQEKPVLVIGGKANNVFLHSDYVQHVSSLDEAMARLMEM